MISPDLILDASNTLMRSTSSTGFALGVTETVQDLILYLFQLLLHLSIADYEGVLSILKVRSLLCHYYTEQLVLKTTMGEWGGKGGIW